MQAQQKNTSIYTGEYWKETEGNGSLANGRHTEKTGDAELPESQCSCTVSPLRRHGTLRPSRVALLQVLKFLISLF